MGIELRQLVGPEGPRNLASALARPQEALERVKHIDLAAGARKAEFLNAELTHFFVGDCPVDVGVVKSQWNEDAHKHKYMVPGLSPALKIGVQPEVAEGGSMTHEPTIILATDVTLEVAEGTIHKRENGFTREQVEEDLVELLTAQRQFRATSSMAGMRNDLQEGLVVNSSLEFTVSPLTQEEVHEYVVSLSDVQLLRSPGGLLWPHKILQNHIVEIGGVGHDNGSFDQRKMDLFATLLGVPRELDVLVRVLDSEKLMSIVQGDNDLFQTLQREHMLPFDEGFKLTGTWAELIIVGDDVYFLVDALPSHYEGMSALAHDNFRNAPNYRYLREPENAEELEKYIAANTPEKVADTCDRPNKLSNLVLLDSNGDVVGFRIVRKEGDVADGRRIHVSRHLTGKGLGGLLLTRSEQYAKQAGCVRMDVHATGESVGFFEGLGYVNHGQVSNGRGVFKDKPSKFSLMKKNL
ncbi:hypothetical protein A2334_06075 [Candidatus Roizmanbacteria bacterium RIFOXYB2_FULL_38_10]|uniref:N-acetyltransferase domain-containing protein n=1 Tax=Candidatus Roizmanbacteria bacterium RIFOXYD1_FULL_38_12 TaxID=1802093 RepID=A0A1F7L1W8_9BACT|nr:MAG: hypothetical protein A3K47_05075 [Candidatus Roizmanbacteria bacterium RIFOXYA2_FULL_38_14]OGK64120.1 MAG: hypothetical protein A3K27_05075 [Candidatus Roizmanbacteria bacterium RIFOXYA1_FULL_37_12]OGK65966.1 MAG: hypothetical protein A3K38_05075 [Candidatus Roizmanbacteria bacterium RIFOXYB1_FULL_40_23]OGK68413.1 MAG: hypothetical protein A2334_06075 [Candidatus Roizmanbacteria bacterium RIFOXYB2_FULL_38_10]OGK70371.1 MAG: hypothetical protein A3K21_05080 [Candidatus Roizmanbacteria ba